MSKPVVISPTTITAEIDAETLATVEALAHARGISGAAFAAEAIRRVAESEFDLLAFVDAGAKSIAQGDFLEHDAFVASLKAWRETRTRMA